TCAVVRPRRGRCLPPPRQRSIPIGADRFVSSCRKGITNLVFVHCMFLPVCSVSQISIGRKSDLDTCKHGRFCKRTPRLERWQQPKEKTPMNGSMDQTDMMALLSAFAGETRAERFARGSEVLKRIGGAGYDIPVNRLAQVAPDLARFTVEFAYGDILSRPGLDLRLRQIATVAALMAHGSVQP